MAKGRIHIGVGGWTYEPWRGEFYPEGLAQKRELEYAAGKLTSIEINGTYYGSQKPASFRKWHDETPQGFVFSLKGTRYTTNRRVLAEAGESIERFLASGLLELKGKLGPINWQMAPTKQFDPKDFESFLRLLPHSYEGHALRHAIEVRHPSFRSPDFVAMMREHGVAIVTAGDSDFPQIADVTAPFVYARIMGTREEEKLGYPSAALSKWVERAKEWAEGKAPKGLETFGAHKPDGKPRDVFLYVISGHKARNPAAAMAMIERLAK
ncbi:DUF72 domain-containing protein [Roseococcus sp. SYP-B2431]|uniref:DUF72 domain-containing protein n=1 Tax=Roseococcus sp. SYP-B2431 TaxID=2496640 RepID=UPI00103B9C26|nr:DUF72 domain-containing protein [Roseococcus sp. SYP-B2431]TCH97564.1 DUF72 domain-containing protein [Roseococcus sp. SYP-B2431]